MTCPKCDGFLMTVPDDCLCVNCGYRVVLPLKASVSERVYGHRCTRCQEAALPDKKHCLYHEAYLLAYRQRRREAGLRV